MKIKSNFALLKNQPNVISVQSSIMKPYQVENGVSKMFVILKLVENRIKHFTKDKITAISKQSNRKSLFDIVNMKNYLLPITYNTRTNRIVINLSVMGSDDLSRIEPKNIYAAMVYGISFSSLVNGKYNIGRDHYEVISSFMLSLFVKMFGKDYGLLGIYSSEIKKLKFLLSCYVLTAFFGIKDREDIYKSSFRISSYNFREIEGELQNVDFSDIIGLITSLDTFRVMPGINKYRFSSRALWLFGYQFIPAFEDIARFISIVTTSSLTISSLVPTFISKYNETEYNKLINISKNMFSKI